MCPLFPCSSRRPPPSLSLDDHIEGDYLQHRDRRRLNLSHPFSVILSEVEGPLAAATFVRLGA
jgi:hypothetical protein